MRQLRWILAPIIALVLAASALLIPRISGAQTSPAGRCPDVPASLRARVEPAGCITGGDEVAIYAEGFVPGLLVSTILVDERNTFVTNADHAMRVGPNGLLEPGVDTADFYGTALPSGMYLLFIKDPSGRFQPGRAYFQVVGGAEPIPPTPLPEPTDPSTEPPTDEPPDTPPGEEPTTTAGPDETPGGTDGDVPSPTGECATNEPQPAEGGQAWMSDYQPDSNDDVTLCARLIENGEVSLDVTAEADLYFPDDIITYDLSDPDDDGVMRVVIDVSPADPEDVVDVDVYFSNGDVSFTSFTVQ